MTTKELILRLFEIMNQRHLEQLDELLTDDAVFHFPKTTPLEGRRRIATFFRVLFRKYPELIFTVGRIVDNDLMAAAEWTNRGTSKDGAVYTNAGVTIIECVNGKICYISDTFKDTELF